MKTFLTIAGSDPSGGAGIQADMKTASSFGIYSMSVITALTVQNTLGVKSVSPVSSELVRGQMSAVFEDIYPDCVKIGMCVNSKIIDTVADLIDKYRAKNVVLDTILISSSGHRLINIEAEKKLSERLFPLCDVITPNVPEAEHLTGAVIKNEYDMECAAAELHSRYGCAVMLKGGHLNGCDLLYDGDAHWYRHELIDNKNTHGTGCTLSSAIACGLGMGDDLVKAAENAVKYVNGAIADGMDLGKGIGPLNHLYNLDGFR